MTAAVLPPVPGDPGRRTDVDRWIAVTGDHQVGVPDTWPERWPLPPAGTSEQTWSATVAAGCSAEHDQAAAEHAIAAAARHLGLLVGERPHALKEPRVLTDGRRRYRVRVLVTRPGTWTPPGRALQLALWETHQVASRARDGAA